MSDMDIPKGYTCGDCANWRRCTALIDSLEPGATTCDFSPSRFAPKPMDMDANYDETNGTIIGGLFCKYEFCAKHPFFGWNELIAREYFEGDEEAIEWFAVNHPEEFKRGATMIVFDQPGKREIEIINARKNIAYR